MPRGFIKEVNKNQLCYIDMQITILQSHNTIRKMSELSRHDKAVLNCIFNPSLPLSGETYENLSADVEDTEEESSELQSIKTLELEAVHKAENGMLDDALTLLTEAIVKYPTRASLYNNRAQVHQLKRQFQDAFEDLTRAVGLAKSDQQRTLCQALCQRGLLHRRADRPELAKADFERASNLGSHFAKSQLIEMNPYAALCNQMLQKVIADLK